MGGDSTAKKTRDDYMKLICKRSPKSELCGNTKMYDMMAAIAGQYDVPMWLMLWIMSKESWFGTLWHDTNTADCKSNTYNRHWSKANNTANGVKKTTNIWPWCWLQKYDSIEEWTTSLARTLWIWYKTCMTKWNARNVATCIAYKYVWSPSVAEESRVSHVIWFAK